MVAPMNNLIARTVVLTTLALSVAAPASADPSKATNLSTFTRTCGDDVYSTYKAGRGAAFVAGEDYKFVNFYGNAAGHAGEVECTYVHDQSGFEGATTSRVVGGGR